MIIVDYRIISVWYISEKQKAGGSICKVFVSVLFQRRGSGSPTCLSVQGLSYTILGFLIIIIVTYSRV